MNSIMQDTKECYICRMKLKAFGMPELPLPDSRLHQHHVIFGTANREKSDELGLWVWLCPEHHTNGPHAVHRDRAAAEELMRIGQAAFEEHHSRAEWMREFGRNYLDAQE